MPAVDGLSVQFTEVLLGFTAIIRQTEQLAARSAEAELSHVINIRTNC